MRGPIPQVSEEIPPSPPACPRRAAYATQGMPCGEVQSLGSVARRIASAPELSWDPSEGNSFRPHPACRPRIGIAHGVHVALMCVPSDENPIARPSPPPRGTPSPRHRATPQPRAAAGHQSSLRLATEAVFTHVRYSRPSANVRRLKAGQEKARQSPRILATRNALTSRMPSPA